METRIAVASVIVEETTVSEELNAIIHEYRNFIIGRMGIPYQKHNLALISVVMDAPNDIISAFSGKVGMLAGVTIKTAYSRILNSSENKTVG